MDSWLQRARSIAEEAAKKSRELTKEAAKISEGLVTETAKKSRELAVEATKAADQIKTEAIKRADRIKSITEGISPSAATVVSIPSILTRDPPAETLDLEKYGVTDELREFVKGLTISTFQDFPLEDEPSVTEVPMVSNVRQDLSEWQAKHATLVLSSVTEISKFRYELCPRHMKERWFWRIYFTLVKSHIAPYEQRVMEEAKLNATLKEKDVGVSENQQPTGLSSKTKQIELQKKTKTSTEHDLDVFLLGDLGSSDDEAGDVDDDGGFEDDDLDKIVNAPAK